jgi:hypothetical protein
MNQEVKRLINEVETARSRYLSKVNTLSQQQASWKLSPEVWNVVEITEHLFWAEQGGIYGMWKILQTHKEGNIGWEGEAIHQGLSIEEIVERTWQPKEIVPVVAAPRLGGTIAFWAASLQSLTLPLQKLGDELTDESLSIMTHPHPISGAMDFRQRLEFLRFHIDRHYNQVLASIEQR